MPTSPNLISPTSNINKYHQIMPPTVTPNQRQRALNKNTQLQQDYKKHMAAAVLAATSPVNSPNFVSITKSEVYDHDQENYEINEDQENYHNYSKLHNDASPAADEGLNDMKDENPTTVMDSVRRNISNGQTNATNENLPNVNKRKKPNIQNFENLDFGDTADELDTDYENIDEYEQTAIDSANLLDDEDEGKIGKKSNHSSTAFTDDEGGAVTSAHSMDQSRFQFPVLTDKNKCLTTPNQIKKNRPRSNSISKKPHALTKPNSSQQRKLKKKNKQIIILNID